MARGQLSLETSLQMEPVPQTLSSPESLPAWNAEAFEVQEVAYQLLKEGRTQGLFAGGLVCPPMSMLSLSTALPILQVTLTIQVFHASLLSLLSYMSALASCLAAGTND